MTKINKLAQFFIVLRKVVLYGFVFIVSIVFAFISYIAPQNANAVAQTYYAKSGAVPNFATTDGTASNLVNQVDSFDGIYSIDLEFGKKTGSTYTAWGSASMAPQYNGTYTWSGNLTLATDKTLAVGDKLYLKISVDGEYGTASKYYDSADVGTANSGVSAGTLPFVVKYNDQDYFMKTYEGASQTYVGGINLVARSSNQNPNSPASLTQKTSPAGASISESAYTTDSTPNLGFTVSDPDAADTVKYQAQLTTAADTGFAAPIIDYTHGSLSANNTTFAFTIGSYGGGSCTGTCPASLSDSSSGYLWRVRAIDNSGVTSAWVQFGVAGTVDLRVDSVNPTTTGAITAGSLGTNGWYISNITYTLTPADTTSGVASTLYCADTVGSCTPNLTYSSALTLSTESATNHIRWQSTDNAGNAQAIQDSGVIKIDKTNPVAASGLVFTNTTTSSLTLSWDGSSDGGAGLANPAYHIERAPDNSGTPGAFVEIGTSNTTSHDDVSLTAGTKYWYRVRSLDSAGNYSAYSSDAGKVTLTNVPTSPTISTPSETQINLSWGAPAQGSVDHYHVYSSSDNYATPIYNLAGASTSQSGLNPNTQYTYRIYGVNADNAESATYASVSKYTLVAVPVLDVPATPTNNNKPTITGTTTANVTVKLYDNVTLVATTTSDGAGNFTFDAPTYSQAFAEGNHTQINAQATNGDAVVSASSNNVTVLVDITAPVTVDSGTDTAWHSTPVTVILTPADGGSGVASTYYTTDGTDPTTNSAQGVSIVLSTNGTYTIKYFSVDSAGNSEAIKTTANTVKINITAPNVPVVPPATINTAIVSGSSVSYVTSSEVAVDSALQQEAPSKEHQETPQTNKIVNTSPDNHQKNWFNPFVNAFTGIGSAIKRVANGIGHSSVVAFDAVGDMFGCLGSNIAKFAHKSIVVADNALDIALKTVKGSVAVPRHMAVLLQDSFACTKNFISDISFRSGTSIQGISNTVGVSIVNFGYLFVKEPTQIFDVRIDEVSSTSAKISWATNGPADGKVNYGLSEAYPLSVQSSSRSTRHEFTLKDLTPNTQYYFEVMSQGKTYVYDANRKFKTPE